LLQDDFSDLWTRKSSSSSNTNRISSNKVQMGLGAR